MAATNMRRAVNAVTDFVFPVPKQAYDQQELYVLKAGHQEYVSSLPLQIAMYFNVLYYPFWLATEIVMLVAKFDSLDLLYKIIIIAILVCMTVIEIIRLYTGYVGNLSEKVPELAGCWLLTLLLQSPLVLFLLFNEATIITPIERAVTIVLTAFVLIEDLIGYFAIRAMINSQVSKFHQQQFTSLDQIEDPYNESYVESTTAAHRRLHAS